MAEDSATLWARYRTLLLILLPGLSVSVALANAILDPYEAYRWIPLPELATYRQARETRIARAEMLAHAPCELVILGTSRAQVALDPTHPDWGRAGCNLAITGAGIAEVSAVLDAVLARSPLPDEIIWTLDFLSFRAGDPRHPEFVRSRFNPDLDRFEYHAGLLLGGGAVRASWRMLRDYWDDEPSPVSELGLTDLGGRGRTAPYYERFVWALERDVRSLGSPSAIVYDASTVSRVVAGARRARELGIRVTLLILPSHALHYESLDRFGAWDAFEAWRSDLVAARDRAAQQEVPIWDCTGFHGPLVEPVPGDAEDPAEMRWHWDSVHVKRQLGDRIIREIRGGDSPSEDRLCAQLVEASLRSWLERARLDRDRYRATQSAQLRLIDDAAARLGRP